MIGLEVQKDTTKKKVVWEKMIEEEVRVAIMENISVVTVVVLMTKGEAVRVVDIITLLDV